MGFTSDSISGTSISANTFYINSVGSGTSITNLGVDLNGNVVSGATASPYKVYTALLTQNNSINGGNPVVLNVLENTIGNITWTKLTTGIYIGTLSNAFVENKTFAIAGQANTSEIWFDLNFGLDFTVDTIPLYRTDNSGAAIDNWGMPISIEIRVYN